MTHPASQQPKEYIITEFQLKQLQGYADLDFVCKAIRSRPHPAPQAPETTSPDNWCPFQQGCKDGEDHCDWPCERWFEWHDAAIERKAREEVLNLLEEWDYHNNRNFGKPHPVFFDMIRMVRDKPDEVRRHLESLRHNTQEVRR